MHVARMKQIKKCIKILKEIDCLEDLGIGLRRLFKYTLINMM
jgi:hypothetical protein